MSGSPEASSRNQLENVKSRLCLRHGGVWAPMQCHHVSAAFTCAFTSLTEGLTSLAPPFSPSKVETPVGTQWKDDSF